jgi:hypothetical protein
MVLLACSRGDDEEVKTAPLVLGRRGRGSCVLLPRSGGGSLKVVVGRLCSANEEEQGVACLFARRRGGG